MVLALGGASSAMFLVALQQSASDIAADAMLDANLNRMSENGLKIAEQAVGSGLGGISWTLLVGAFVPVIYRVIQIAGEAFQREHQRLPHLDARAGHPLA